MSAGTPPLSSSPLAFAVGDTVRLRKAHPCGGRDWQVVRVGADIGLACVGCGRRIFLSRDDVERRRVRPEAAVPSSDVPPAL